MGFIILIKANKDSKAAVLPDEKLLRETQQFNEQPVTTAGMVASEGLHSRSKRKPDRLSGEKRTVIDGPFAETKELIAGFWPWQVKSREQGNESVKLASFADSSDRTEMEIRQAFEVESFDGEFAGEVSEHEEHLRARSER